MNRTEFVGIDIAKDKFDAALWVNEKYRTQEFSNTPKGFTAFLAWCEKHTKTPWFCMEATGIYGEELANFLYKHHYKVSVINPLKIKRYAQSKLVRNKTDPLDAKIIAEFGWINKPRTYKPKPVCRKEITELVNLLNVQKGQLVRLKNQLPTLKGKESKQRVESGIAGLEKEIKEIEKSLENQVKKDAELTKQKSLLMTIPGVGPATTHAILGRVGDIQQFTIAKEFAAFLGLTPYQRQSGKYRGKTMMSRMGDATLRKVIYMAALVAKRYNPILKVFFERLKAKGKHVKAAIGAVMRKLAHIIFGVLKNQTAFNPCANLVSP